MQLRKNISLEWVLNCYYTNVILEISIMKAFLTKPKEHQLEQTETPNKVYLTHRKINLNPNPISFPDL